MIMDFVNKYNVYFETGTHYIGQANHKLATLCPSLPHSWYYEKIQRKTIEKQFHLQ
jgi:hypothetical protein